MRGSSTLLVLLFVPLVAAAADDPPTGWKEVKGGFKNQAYAVWLPADGKTESSQDSIVARSYGQIRVFRTVCERKDGSVLAAGQIILPPKLTRAAPKVRQNLLRDLFLKEVNGKLVEEKATRLGTMAGKEYLAKTPTGMARLRLLGTGVLMFRVVFVGTKEQLESKDADTFFKSFKRTQAKPDKEDK